MANFRNYENQLRNYLLGRVRNKDELQIAMRKYANLRILMNHEKYDRPHFIIKMGISEAVFDIDSGIQLGGGLGPESNDVKNWISKNLKKTDIKAIWKTEYKEHLVKKELEDGITGRDTKKKR